MYYATSLDALAERVLNSLENSATEWSNIEFGVQPCSADSYGWVMESENWLKVTPELDHPECSLMDLPDKYRPVWFKHRTANGEQDIGPDVVRNDLRTAKLLHRDSKFDSTDENRIMLYVPVARFLHEGKNGAGDIEFFISVRCAKPQENEKAIWLALYRIKTFCDSSGCRLSTSIPPSYLVSVMFSASREEASLMSNY